ncbi:MAG: hypothetical protein HYZ11_02295 [Candidatus Tectomicrobia bacterium]|uniref:Uncharacterized protein n=1 Tax=Tectimicrobiota bacterium TaxID=2528274 RepID=A0A932MMD0_UNCTE|nr:hypothetical protein [Candidatus Tectomicrobia bacterium]
MVEAQVKQVDRANKVLVVQTADGKEISMHVGEHANVEVLEPATAGLISGTLDDIEVGYLVNLEYTEGAGGCSCSSLECIS